MHSNEVNKEVKFRTTMLRCEHILSIRRAQKKQLSLILKGKNPPGKTRKDLKLRKHLPSKE